MPLRLQVSWYHGWRGRPGVIHTHLGPTRQGLSEHIRVRTAMVRWIHSCGHGNSSANTLCWQQWFSEHILVRTASMHIGSFQMLILFYVMHILRVNVAHCFVNWLIYMFTSFEYDDPWGQAPDGITGCNALSVDCSWFGHRPRRMIRLQTLIIVLHVNHWLLSRTPVLTVWSVFRILLVDDAGTKSNWYNTLPHLNRLASSHSRNTHLWCVPHCENSALTWPHGETLMSYSLTVKHSSVSRPHGETLICLTWW